MHNLAIWNHLQRVQQKLKHDTLNTQDATINDLQHYLEESCLSLFPAFLYPQLVEVLSFYCTDILPHLNMSDKDRQFILEDFRRTISRLTTQKQLANDLERRFKQFFHQVKSGLFTSVQEVVAAIHTIIVSQSGEISFSGNIQHDKELEKQYHKLKKSPFTSSRVLPFFQTLVSRALPEELQRQFEYAKALFWDQLHECIQMKAVLVNPLTKKAFVTRLDIETTLRPLGLDELEFENTVDDQMYLSCWNAIQAARSFLEKYFPELIKNTSIHVNCRFPNPTVEYHDTSASLPVGLKLIGDILNFEIDPHVLVSGEVDNSEMIRPILHVTEKVTIAEYQSDILQLYLPENSLHIKSNHITVTYVGTFTEAVHHYYEKQLQKMNFFCRKQHLLKNIIDTFTTSLPSLISVREMFAPSLTEQDIWSIDYAKDLYQKHNEYQEAIRILQFILTKFERRNSSEVLYIKARTFKHLGWIYWNRWDIAQSPKEFSLLRKAFELWSLISDREQQVEAAFNIGDVYLNYIPFSNIPTEYGEISLRCFKQAKEMLKPSMKAFRKLNGRYYGCLGDLYYYLNENEIAEKYFRRGFELDLFDDIDTDWDCQQFKQTLGRTLIRLGKYDEAHELLQNTAQTSALQSPVDRARTYWSFCDLFLSLGDYEQGLEFAFKSAKLSKERAIGHYIVLQKILEWHHLSPSILTTV